VVHKATGPQRADPPQLLALWRRHWSIENRLHSIRDLIFDEDRATARADHGPQVMAAFRNAAIGLIRALGTTRVAATCRMSLPSRSPPPSPSASRPTLNRFWRVGLSVGRSPAIISVLAIVIFGQTVGRFM